MSYGLYLLLSFVGLGFALLASFWTSSSFNRYRGTPTKRSITPVQLAKEIIEGENLNLSLEYTDGQLTDHYDPLRNIVRLGRETANTTGLSPLAVTAHEFGHALQDKQGGILFKFRNMIAGLVGISTNIGYFLIMIGLVLSYFDLAQIGLVLFSATTIFMFITLPIEFDASRRGLALLKKYDVVSDYEYGAARTVLTAAALTYVAGFLQSLLQLVYFASLISGRRRND